jgi:AcrR family transcriptional regulator
MKLLDDGGRDAVTTRAVAAHAGLQPTAIYRMFGDKDGLLSAVAEHGYATFVADKQLTDPHPDPVEDLRRSWTIAVEFGVSNPELYALIYTELDIGAVDQALSAARELVRGHIRRVAAAGRLRINETLAAATIQATARGTVLTWLALPADERDPALIATMREAMINTVTTDPPPGHVLGPVGAARTLRAALPEPTKLSRAENQMLLEWLDRLTSDPDA